MSRADIKQKALNNAQKQQLRKRIESNPHLKEDFDFLIEKTTLRPRQLLTGLWMDCNMMTVKLGKLLKMEKSEALPIEEQTLRRTIKDIRSLAQQIEATNKTHFSPLRDLGIGHKFFGLPKTLRAYATELERAVDAWVRYWKRRRVHIPGVLALTRQHSVFERIRVLCGSYHQNRLLRLLNTARHVHGYSSITGRALAVWLNRFEKRRTEYEH